MDRVGAGAPQAVNVGSSKPADETADEDSSVLKLGEIFENSAQALSNSELKLILDKVVLTRKASQGGNVQLSAATQKTIDYVNRFYVFDSVEAMDQLRATLASAECQEFEIGALMNLCPDTPEEARSLVQSLENVGGREQLDDDRLQQLLDELRTYRSAMR
eukprot:PRCOL_00001299-RA